MPFLDGLFGPPNVKRLKKRGNVAGLIKALSYEDDADVRRRAADALGRIGDGRAEAPLVAALQDEELAVQFAAARALQTIGDERAVEPLIDALRNGDEWIHGAAASALGSIGDPRAVEPLIEALSDRERHNRSDAAIALGGLGDPRAVEPLIEGLKRRGDTFCARALGEIRDARAVDPLVAALASGGPALRRTAAEALGNIGAPEAVDPLIEALEDTNAKVRYHAAQALALIGDRRAVEPLIAALEDANAKVRYYSTLALAQIGDLRAVEPLMAALEDDHVQAGASAVAGERLSFQDMRELADLLASTRNARTQRGPTPGPASTHRRAGGADRCHSCGKRVSKDRITMPATDDPWNPLKPVQQVVDAMLAHQIDCPSCGMTFCLECGNNLGHRLGTDKTHCPGCAKAVSASSLDGNAQVHTGSNDRLAG